MLTMETLGFVVLFDFFFYFHSTSRSRISFAFFLLSTFRRRLVHKWFASRVDEILIYGAVLPFRQSHVARQKSLDKFSMINLRAGSTRETLSSGGGQIIRVFIATPRDKVRPNYLEKASLALNNGYLAHLQFSNYHDFERLVNFILHWFVFFLMNQHLHSSF